ncbi:STAS domain-containing protein [Lysinibacillus sphaericus]|uniref:Anti-sigma F factor antagonist n=1 Tax=Lysinibacillus sphaericus OT4b.31 TaxID=1285586 RepID=R7ZG24_LYSSH|nr:STAS domain-containing protein [Lysinibacillus sphaericus]EON73072.1 anti-sigma F factor antagonist [Lysinibacillus sphaericus OT4b.31]
MAQKKISMDINTKANYIVITFTGDLEYGLIEDIKKDLQALKLETMHGYIIDMQKVTNVDSTGFGMIVNFAKKVSIKEKRIAIIVVDDFIRNLFAISQCDKIFPIAQSEDEAKQIIKEGWSGELSLSEY